MLNIPSYEQFVRHNLGLQDGDRRDIEGVFKNSKTKKIIKGDNFSCISINGNAEKSYRAALKYYNHTRYDESDAERIFVSAKWKPKEELNT